LIKISLITVTYNADKFLEACFASVRVQKGVNLEYIVIDGGSTDNTLKIVQVNGNLISHFVSEKDQGMYDALNKGINLATGDVIGVLNADDMLASDTILRQVSLKMDESGADILYGDLDYIDPENNNKIIRHWRSRPYKRGLFQWGWMPAHPTFYARRELFEQYGNYRLDMGSAADYELMIRFLHKHKVKAVYLPEVMVKMRAGGMSNNSLTARLKANKADREAMKINGLEHPWLAALLKPIRKIPQFLGF
jgi:glycosyltransferase